MISPEIALSLWHRALNEEIGIAVETPNVRFLQNLLWEVRKNAEEPELDKLLVMLPNTPNTIFICKKQVELDGPL